MMKRVFILFAITHLSWCQLFSQENIISSMTIEECMTKPGFTFCTPADDISNRNNTDKPNEAYGNCCPPDSGDNRCIDSGNPLAGVQCSYPIPDPSNLTDADIGMFMTYELGMLRERARACGTATGNSDIVLVASGAE